jgi:2-iminobutanoate/2-iminopropanoate deaminase
VIGSAARNNQHSDFTPAASFPLMTPLPALPFSKVRRAAGLVFLSGDLPIAADGSVPDGIEAQTTLTLQRITATLQSEGLTLADVVSVTAYLVNPADFAGFNRVYAGAFPQPRPVRTTVRADLMLPKALLELTVIASAQP